MLTYVCLYIIKYHRRKNDEPNNVSKSDSEIVPDTTVDSDFLICYCIIWENNAHGLFAPLSFKQDCIATEEL